MFSFLSPCSTPPSFPFRSFSSSLNSTQHLHLHSLPDLVLSRVAMHLKSLKSVDSIKGIQLANRWALTYYAKETKKVHSHNLPFSIFTWAAPPTHTDAHTLPPEALRILIFHIKAQRKRGQHTHKHTSTQTKQPGLEGDRSELVPLACPLPFARHSLLCSQQRTWHFFVIACDLCPLPVLVNSVTAGLCHSSLSVELKCPKFESHTLPTLTLAPAFSKANDSPVNV